MTEVGCYLTGVVGRWVCLGRFPATPAKWCANCKRENAASNDRSTRLAGEKSEPGAASTAPARGHHLSERR